MRRALAVAAVTSGEVTADLTSVSDSTGIRFQIGSAAPLVWRANTSGESVAFAVLYVDFDADVYIRPMLESWPVPARHGQTLLLREPIAESAQLGTARVVPVKPEMKAAPSQSAILAFLSQTGRRSSSDFLDTPNGTFMLAAERIQGTPWTVIRAQSTDEVEAPLTRLALWSAGSAGTALLAAALTIALIWRYQNIIQVQALARARLEREALAKHFNYATRYARDIVLLFDESLKLLECSESAVRAYGYTEEEFQRLDLRRLRVPAQRKNLASDLEKAVRSEGTTFETVHQRKDGSAFPVEVSMRLIESEGRRFYQSVARDVTERKRAEQAMRESEARYRELTELSSDWLWEMDAEYRFTHLSPRFFELTGLKPEQVLGQRSWETDRVAVNAEGWLSFRANLEARRPFRNYEMVRKNANGDLMWIAGSGNPTFDEHGRFSGYRGTSRNITVRKRAERRIERLARLYATLSGVNQAMVHVSSEQELYDRICRVVVEHGGMLGGIVRIADTEAKILRLVACSESLRPIVEKIVVGFDPALPEFKRPIATAYVEDRIVIDNDIEARVAARSEERRVGKECRL